MRRAAVGAESQPACWGFLLLTLCFTPHIYIRVWLCILFSFCTDFLCFCGKAPHSSYIFYECIFNPCVLASCLMHFTHWYLNAVLLFVMHYFSLFFLQSFTVFSDGKTTNSECDPTARSHKCLSIWIIGLNAFDMLSIIIMWTVLGNAYAFRAMLWVGVVFWRLLRTVTPAQTRLRERRCCFDAQLKI